MATESIKEAHESSLAAWDGASAGWERQHEQIFDATRAVTDKMLERLDPQPGHRILEVASGIGETGFIAAKTIGDSGRLISTDFAPGMVAGAQRRAKALGLKNVEHRLMSALEMSLESDSVDGVLCRFGFMLMVDQKAAFTETRRVLRDGGRLSFAVWGPAEKNPWIVIPGMVGVQLGFFESTDPSEEGGPFSLAQPEAFNKLLGATGFGDPAVDEVQVTFRFPDLKTRVADLIETSGRLGQALKELGPEDVIRFTKALAEPMEPYRTQDGFAVTGVALVVSTS